MTESPPPTAPPPPLQYARREALFVVVMLLVTLIYTLTYCYLFGYARHTPAPNLLGMQLDLSRFDRSAEGLRLVYGMPEWVWLGIVVPWLVCWAVTVWFSLCFMKDEDLGEDHYGVQEQLNE